jgi:hypothetical protein
MKFQKILEILELTCYPETHQLGWKMILENEQEIIKSLRRNKNVKLVEVYRQDMAYGVWTARFTLDFHDCIEGFCSFDDDFLHGAVENDYLERNIKTIKKFKI